MIRSSSPPCTGTGSLSRLVVSIRLVLTSRSANYNNNMTLAIGILWEISLSTKYYTFSNSRAGAYFLHTRGISSATNTLYSPTPGHLGFPTSHTYVPTPLSISISVAAASYETLTTLRNRGWRCTEHQLGRLVSCPQGNRGSRFHANHIYIKFRQEGHPAPRRGNTRPGRDGAKYVGLVGVNHSRAQEKHLVGNKEDLERT